MPEYTKGDRVQIIDGKAKGIFGTVFWEGPSKFGSGRRVGIRSDDGATHWAADSELTHEAGTGSAAPPVSPSPPVSPASPDVSTVEKRFKAALKKYQEKPARKALETLPREQQALLLWKLVGRELLSWYDLQVYAVELAKLVPTKDIVAALRRRNKKSDLFPLPGVGALTIEMLNLLHRHNPDALTEIRDKLPRDFQLAVAYILDDITPAQRELFRKQIISHLLDGESGYIDPGPVLERFQVDLDSLRDELLTRARDENLPLPFPSVAPLFVDRDPAFFEAWVSKFNLDDFAGDLPRFLPRRRALLPEESLAETLRILSIFEAVVRKPRKPSPYLLRIIEESAVALGAAALARGEELPTELLTFFRGAPEPAASWVPLIEALDKEPRTRHLEALFAERPELKPLFAHLMPIDIEAMTDDLVAKLHKTTGVGLPTFCSEYATLGAPMADALIARIEALSAAIDLDAHAWGDGYRPRRVIISLRNTLILTISRMVAEGHTLPDNLETYLGPTPAWLFQENDDFAYSFFTGLRGARELFDALPEERVLAWIEAWRSSNLSAHIEERLALPLSNKRKKLLKGAPSLASRITKTGADTGRDCTTPIYILSHARKSKKNANSLSRVSPKLPRPLLDKLPAGLVPVLTVDLQEIPELQDRYPDTRAICLCVDAPRHGFELASILRFSQDECAEPFDGTPIQAERALVPAGVFHQSPDPALKLLRRLISEAPARALGGPFFIQSDTSEADQRHFVLEARQDFSRLNLGDSGKLFVFTDDATWESH